jgi:hypothetical protein
VRIAITKTGLIVVAAVAATVAPPAGHAADEAPAAPPTPREGCVTFTDDAEDASVSGAPNDSDLDILSVVLASPPEKLRAYIKVAELSSPSLGAGHQFVVSYKLPSGKVVDIFAGESEAAAVHDVAGPMVAPPLTGANFDGGAIADAKVEAVFDAKTHTVVITADRAPLAAAAKEPLTDGIVMSSVTAASQADFVVTMMSADTAAAKDAAAQAYTLGDNTCFAPPAGKLALTVPAYVVTGHTAVIGGTLTNTAGTAVAGKNVTVSVAGKTAQVTSGADGTFSASFAISSLAGSYPVTASWAGDDSLQAATATAPLTVRIQPTSASLAQTVSGTTAYVTATLVDDLRKPLGGQVVTWYVDGKSVASYRTDSRGKSTLRTVRGKTVKVVYSGVRNRYAGSTASRRT